MPSITRFGIEHERGEKSTFVRVRRRALSAWRGLEIRRESFFFLTFFFRVYFARNGSRAEENVLEETFVSNS